MAEIITIIPAMEGFPEPEDKAAEAEKARVVKAAILEVLLKLSEEFRSKAGLSLKDILVEERFASSIYDHVAAELSAQGLAYDSLDLIELIMQIEEGDEPGDEPNEGGSGVREPRRPFPTGGLDSIALYRRPVRRIETFSRNPDLSAHFTELATDLKGRTAFVSSLSQIYEDSAYQEIIELGPDIVPDVIDELKSEPHPLWFGALAQLTGTDAAEGVDTVEEALTKWLEWADQDLPEALGQ